MSLKSRKENSPRRHGGTERERVPENAPLFLHSLLSSVPLCLRGEMPFSGLDIHEQSTIGFWIMPSLPMLCSTFLIRKL